jgi:hypothetical protein
MTTQLPRQLPTDTPTDTAALTDTLDFGIGRSAARLLEDPLRSIPAQVREW